jgi:integrase/recombinase XerD
MLRRTVVTVYVRHRADCQHDGKAFFRGCDCPKWLRYSGDACLCGRAHQGRQHRLSAETRTWMLAEEKAQELQKRLDAGETTAPASTQVTAAPRTIADELKTYIVAKQGERLSTATLRKLKYQLNLFEQFMSRRSKFFAREITTTDVIEFRASWKWKSGVTRQKAQQNLRGFLRLCCTNNLQPLLDVLKPIKLSKTDMSRLKPQPFSEAELKALLAQVPKTFPDKEKAARVTALIHCQVSTGLAIRDTIQLERKNLSDGWLRIERQKTNKPVAQKLDPALYQELMTVTNGNPRFVFWNGTSLPESATGLWQTDLRTLMKDAGVWIKGNLSHRFRDTAVDFWLEQGASMTDVAASLGDTVRTVERHYADLASKRMGDRLAKMPTRSWGTGAGR